LALNKNKNKEYYCFQLLNRHEALSIAVQMAAKTPPFSEYKAGDLAPVIQGEIERGHYVFTFSTQGELQGYAGWALCYQHIAKRIVYEGYRARYDECCIGDSLVLLTVIAESKGAFLQQRNLIRHLHHGKFIYYNRIYAKKTAFSNHAGRKKI